MSYFKFSSFWVFVLVLGLATQAENEQESFNSLALRCAPNIAVDGYFAQSDPVKRSFYISDSLG